MRQTKGCGCLIGSSVVDLEKSRRKNKLRIKEINGKLRKVKDSKKIAELKAEKKELVITLKQTTRHKHTMKRHFHKHIKKSGYVPPKFKGV